VGEIALANQPMPFCFIDCSSFLKLCKLNLQFILTIGVSCAYGITPASTSQAKPMQGKASKTAHSAWRLP
jgi:hypothetical protein